MHSIWRWRGKFLCICTLVVCGCSHSVKSPHQRREAHFTRTTFNTLEGWRDDDHLEAFKAFCASCTAIKRRSDTANMGGVGGNVRHWKRVCSKADRVAHNRLEARHFFEENFYPYIIRTSYAQHFGKFTGYYEVQLNGRRTPDAKFKYPVYRTPENLEDIKGTVAITRGAINRGALRGRGLEIAWVDDYSGLFNMQIQGSGVINLNAGQKIHIGYAAQNGHSYTAIAPIFKARYPSAKESMWQWLEINPRAAISIMEQDKSYVFFRERPHNNSPIGAQGVSLTPERSLAIDYKIYPYGTPMWVHTTMPSIVNMLKKDNKCSRNRTCHYRRLFIAQDTGGAIKGGIRADIFFGRGKYAEILARSMNASGRYYALFPKAVHIPEVYVYRP